MAKLPMGQMAPTGGDTMGHFENQWANGPKSLVNHIPENWLINAISRFSIYLTLFFNLGVRLTKTPLGHPEIVLRHHLYSQNIGTHTY